MPSLDYKMVADILENIKKENMQEYVEINILVYMLLVTFLYLYSPKYKHISSLQPVCKILLVNSFSF